MSRPPAGRVTPSSPRVSVILPVYNCPQYVGEAIESILSQTFQDFEFIVIDDGSTDETPAVLRRYNDPRIRLVTQTNRGLAATLNRGIELAQGTYLARQDQDDVSLPERLDKQVRYLDAHGECALVGTWAQIWEENTPTPRAHRHPSEVSAIGYAMLLDSPFVHSSVMLRRDVVQRVGGYSTDPARQPPEDYELWSRLARRYRLANLPEILVVYREISGSLSRIGLSPFLDRLVTICAENIAWAAETSAADENVRNIAALTHRAWHRIQGVPRFRGMLGIFRKATAAVVMAEQRPAFLRAADVKIAELWCLYWEERMKRYRMEYLVKAVKRMIPRIARLHVRLVGKP